jgi:outer membrane protein
VRAGAAWVVPNDDSGNVSGIPGSEVSVDSAVSLGVTLGYMVTNNVGIGLLAAWPFEHDIQGERSISGLGRIATIKQLPPTLTVHYHFLPEGSIRPYVGAGLNYTWFFDEDASSSLEGALGPTSIDLDNSWGLAGEAGVDVTLKDNWFLNASVWYLDINTTAALKTDIAKLKVDVDINPWVFMIGVGTKF